jgi:hypothetical protein
MSTARKSKTKALGAKKKAASGCSPASFGRSPAGFGRSAEEFERLHVETANEAFLRRRVAELESQALKEKVATGEALEIIRAVQDSIAQAVPPKFNYRPGNKSKSPCVHVLHLTDIHYGEVVVADDIDGFGEYSPEIAERRTEALARMVINKTKAQRAAYNVPELHIIGTGDYISGGIHPELKVTNAFPEPVQAVRCGYMLGAMFAGFAPWFKQVTVDMITLDNHGRLTRKPQAAQGGLNNWGYVVAEVAKQHVAKIKNIRVNVHAKPSALIPVGPERYLAFHGHQIRGWAGKPYYGFDRRAAMESIKRMGAADAGFTKLLLGHFHHGVDADIWKLGGSMSGTNAFDASCGRHSKPHQTSWFVHPKHGEFDWTRWWL